MITFFNVIYTKSTFYRNKEIIISHFSNDVDSRQRNSDVTLVNRYENLAILCSVFKF